MDDERKKSQIKWGVVLSYANQLITILSGLIYTPIMLRILGQSEFGLYQLAHSVILYLGLLNLGFSSGYLRIYFRFKNINDEARINNLNGLYLIIFLIISLVSAILGAVLIMNRQYMFGNSLSMDELYKMGPLMTIMLVSLVFSFLSSIFECYISAYSEFIFQRGLQTVKGVLNPLVTLPLLLNGQGSIAMAFVACALTIVSFIVTVYYCVKRLRMKFSFNNLERNVAKDLSTFTIYIFISSVVDKINLSLDNFLLGCMCGTIMVSIYGVGSQINGFYCMMTSSIASIFAPKINSIVAKSDNNDQLTNFFIKISRIMFMMLFLVIIGFVFFGRKFIMLWAGVDYSDSYYVSLMLMIGSIIPFVQICGIEIQKAKNMHKVRSIAFLVVAILNIVISIPLIKSFGALGASFGTMVTMLAGNGVFMNWYYNNRIGLNMRKYWKSLFALAPIFFLPAIIGGVYLFWGNGSTIGFFAMLTLFVLSFGISVYFDAKRHSLDVRNYIIGNGILL